MTAGEILDPNHLIKSIEHLREIMGHTSDIIWNKATDTLSQPMLDFIARAPFCCLSSRGADGTTDISPRGDGPGFVRALDARTLLIPDRPGNRRYDTLRNVLETRHVSILFLIPNVMDTVRVNGIAQITRDQALLADSEMQGKVPELGMVVTVEEALAQ